MTTYRLVGKCPVCDNDFRVTKMTCNDCGSSLEGDFDLSPLSKLSAEHQRFIEVFIVSRGNIKEVEKNLGISYPTVRARLDGVIEALGYEVDKPSESVDKKAILEALDRGEVSADEALKKLRSSQ